jgi:zinc and cadmium transporter
MNNTDTDNPGVPYEIWLEVLSATFITCLVSLVGALFMTKSVPSIRERNEDFFKYAIAFAVGVILSTIFIHLLPEAGHLLDLSEEDSWKGSIVFLSGIFVSVLLEIIAHQHSHHMNTNNPGSNNGVSDLESHDSTEHVEPVAYTVLIGDSFHNLTDGFLIATAFMVCGSSLGWVVVASVILHEIPHELLDFIILTKAGVTVKKALLLNFLSSLTAIIGAIIILAVNPDESVQGYILTFSAGVLTFVALSQLLPSISKDDHKKPVHVFLMLFGMVLIGLLNLFHPECEEH